MTNIIKFRRTPSQLEKTAIPTITIQTDECLMDAGFEQDECGQLYVDGCRVILYRVGGEWELDIVLPNGNAIGCDVPIGKLTAKIERATP